MSAPIRSIDVRTSKGPYRVEISPGLLDGGRALARFAARGRLIVVSDRKVWRIHGARLDADIAQSGVKVVPLLLPVGESAKSWRNLQRLVEALLELDVERGETLVAFGGGVVGDVAGFAASIVKRGCSFVQVPTSLLAQVDSSVGGKTAINSKSGKNLVGTFHQPAHVLIDTDLISTLPPRQRRNGWAEIVKYGLIGDAGFFDWCEGNGGAALRGPGEELLHAIETSIRAKARIVEADEEERSGTRALLNLGHSFGHALEAETGFSTRLLHGEAVALGMILAFELSRRRGHCPGEDLLRIKRHLAGIGLPTSLAEAGIANDGARLLDHMGKDKKMSGGTLPLILARGIGRAFVDHSVSRAELIDLFASA